MKPVAVALVLALMAGCTERATVSAPAAACKAQYTGRQRVEDTTTQMCAGFDSKGVCTVWMPMYSHTTYNETRVVCDWLEWR
jgi:hypothetical protein